MGLSKSCSSLFILILGISTIYTTPVNDLAKRLSGFSTEFYLQCVKDKPGNVIVSPLSVSSALALLSQAARGSTYEQLAQALNFGDEKSTANQFLEYRNALEQNAGEATFSIANAMYVQEGEKLNKNFQEVAISQFKSGVESLNFGDSEKSAATINHFVEEHTNGKIKELFKPDQFNSDIKSELFHMKSHKTSPHEP